MNQKKKIEKEINALEGEKKGLVGQLERAEGLLQKEFVEWETRQLGIIQREKEREGKKEKECLLF